MTKNARKKASKVARGCKTCKHAAWQRGDKGGIRTSVAGVCEAPIDLDQLRQDVIDMLPECVSAPGILTRHGIWPKDSYGTKCPLWERNQ